MSFDSAKSEGKEEQRGRHPVTMLHFSVPRHPGKRGEGWTNQRSLLNQDAVSRTEGDRFDLQVTAPARTIWALLSWYLSIKVP